MKNNEANIFVFLASIIVGIMISLNMSFSNKIHMTILDTKQYEEAVNKRTQLLEQISKMNTEYNLSYSKLNKYESVGLNNTKLAQEMKNELLKNKMAYGTTDLHGQGIRITLDDGPEEIKRTWSLYMVHNYDLAMILNFLKIAGAEAISVNGERITNMTTVDCDGVFIQTNDNQIYSPFTIEVIGNKDVLYEYMNREEYVKRMLIVRKLRVDIQQVEDVKINGFNRNIKSKFLTVLNK
ncbi:MAG: DUF881 domain-containing protein [Clostridiaceae bacterium]|nr:DUF881 domain-containing protein [Clostridiaceae bacterium]